MLGGEVSGDIVEVEIGGVKLGRRPLMVAAVL
jgi:hypothetical protein